MAQIKTGYQNNVYAPRSMAHELDFSLGMKFVNGTVDDKYVKTLVNFDIKEMGAALAPRAGLRTTEVCLPQIEFLKPATLLNQESDVCVYAAHSCVENGKHYKQFILGHGEKLWVATAEATEDSIGLGEPMDITQYMLEPRKLEEYYNCTVLKPNRASIHGIPLADNDGIASLIGTFGFNNNVFFFDRSKANDPKLCYTEFDVDRYKVKTVTPRQLTASEAPLTGYNMLHDTPYTFEDNFSGAVPILQGVLPYAEDGSLLLRPKRNQPVKFRCYLTAAPNTKYKFLWESRGVSEMSWVQRQKNVDVVFSATEENDPLYCTFVPPEADTQIRVQVFQKHEMDEVIEVLDVADVAPTTGMVDGDKYFNPKSGKLYTYASGWGSGVGITVPTNNQYYFNKATGNYYRCYASNTLSMLMLDEERYDVVCEHQLTVGYDFKQRNIGDKEMISEPEIEKYDLTTATGMVYSQGRLALYGLPKDPTILFFSDFEDFTYFPYPNNMVMFDEPIVHAVEFMDDLLVFTEGALYAVTLGADGGSWTRTKIQGNLWISPWDKRLIQVVRNMVYFKSGNYPFMVVPKAQSMTGELTLAPISTPIKGFLDDFAANVDDIFKQTYGDFLGVNFDPPAAELIDYYNFLDFEDVHNIYVFFKEQDGENDSYVHFDLMYNTVTRAWKTYIYEAPCCISPYQHDATQPGKLCATSLLNIATGKNYEYDLDDPNKFTPVNAGPKVVLVRTEKVGYNTNILGRTLAGIAINSAGTSEDLDKLRIVFCKDDPRYMIQWADYIDFYYEFNATDIKMLGTDGDSRLEVVSIDGLVKLTQFMDNEHANTEELILETMDAEAHLIPYETKGKWVPTWHDSGDAEGVFETYGIPLVGNPNEFGFATPIKDTMFIGELYGDIGPGTVVVSGTDEYILPCDDISIVPSGDLYLITITGNIDPTQYFAINTGHRVQARAIQIMGQSRVEQSDFYIPYLSDMLQYGENFEAMVANTMDRWQDLTDASDDFIHYKNYQMLDSGYRDVDLGFNKRYRELQLSLNKIDDENFRFGIDFILDGQSRPQNYDFYVEQYVDPDKPDQGLAYLTLSNVPDLQVDSPNVFQNIWSIMQTKFREVSMWKLRINLSGKGNAPRFRFVSKNEFAFELTRYAWVYRIKNAR